MPRRFLLTLIFAFAVPAAGLACLWDYDTLEMERSQFPKIAELLSGKFLRHSEAFYHWRIENRLKRIEESPQDAALYDDLAVAYDKTHDQEKAIETILKVQEFEPDRYETLANLGTFHIHSGHLKEGSEFIEKAIEINPDAHFGREVYQKLLVEYVMEKRAAGGLPQPMSEDDASVGRRGFARFVMLEQTGDADHPDKDGEIERAIKGVSGMMRFGHHDSPILLEALADLLMAKSGSESRHLAARAWLKASYETQNTEAAALYRYRADQVLSLQTPGPGEHHRIALEPFEKSFKAELAEANAWYAELAQDEAGWIAAGGDVDEEFRKKYYEAPSLAENTVKRDSPPASGVTGWFWRTGRFALPVVLIVAILLVWRWNVHAQRKSVDAPVHE